MNNNITTLLTGYETIGDHTEFIIQASCGGVVWLISRRFSDFDQLHARLSERYGKKLAQLPEKQWFGRFDPNFLAKRQSKLQLYLSQLLQIPGILENRVLQHFLEMDKNVELTGESGFLYSLSGQTPDEEKARKNDADRMACIVDKTANAFIDVVQGTEHLELEQAQQRKSEILNACQGFANVQCTGQTLAVMQLPPSSSSIEMLHQPHVMPYEQMSQVFKQAESVVQAQLQSETSIPAPSEPLIVQLTTDTP